MSTTGMIWASLLPHLLYVLAYLAGLIVAIILAVRHKSTAAILALIAFAVLFVMSMASFGQGPLIGWLATNVGDLDSYALITGGVGCCCGSINVAAFVLLIVALWKAIAGSGGRRKARKGRSEPAPEPEPELMAMPSVPEPEPLVTPSVPDPEPMVMPEVEQEPIRPEQVTRKIGT